MEKANLVHTNFSPKCIIVTEDFKIKISNFTYSHQV